MFWETCCCPNLPKFAQKIQKDEIPSVLFTLLLGNQIWVTVRLWPCEIIPSLKECLSYNKHTSLNYNLKMEMTHHLASSFVS